jgi:hypothetical protein
VERVPKAGDSVQVTAVLVVPETVAVNWAVWPDVNVVDDGEIDTATTGLTVTVAVADFVVSATEVAVIVTVCGVLTVAGAV